jgi:predicted GNAT family acetyltransferase
MNVENEWDGIVEAQMVEGPVECFGEEEVKKAVNDLKYGKAGGISGVVAEHIRGSADVGVEVLTKICNDMLDGGEMPEEWRNSTLVPLYKGKGNVKECGSYRGVKLLEHGMKVVERVLERRLRDRVEINEMQCGFMQGRGTVDALYMVRMLQEQYARKKKKLYMCFVDLEKAFDRVPRKVIEWALRKKGVEERLVKMVMEMYKRARTRVRIGGTYSEGFDVNVGVHQGSILSPFLFITVMDVVCGSAMEGLLFEILYADDLVLMAESMSELRGKFKAWKEAMERKGLKVNVGKTKYMISGESDRRKVQGVDPCSICGKRVKRNSVLCVSCGLWVHKRCSGIKGALRKVDGVYKCRKCMDGVIDEEEVEEEMGGGVEKVESFVYLGDCVSTVVGCRGAVTARVRAGWKKFRELSGMLCGKGWSLKMKGKLYSTCVRTVMTYGGETWTMRREDEDVLIRAERRMVRMMCGVSMRERRLSSELRESLGVEQDVGDVLRKSRLRWYGHVKRREASVGVKRALEFEVEGKLGRGRPKMVWKDLVCKDMEKGGMRDGEWEDRGTWKKKSGRVGKNR